jgi:hypothetical protein
MVKLNWSRVVLGGVLWAAAFNVVWLSAWIVFLRSEWMSAIAALGRTFPETLGGLVLWFVLTFGGGIFAIWLYAALSRAFSGTPPGKRILVGYGPGPRTAAGVGVIFWLITALGPMLWWAHILALGGTGLIPRTLVVGLVADVAATVVGAWPYKEE